MKKNGLVIWLTGLDNMLQTAFYLNHYFNHDLSQEYRDNLDKKEFCEGVNRFFDEFIQNDIFHFIDRSKNESDSDYKFEKLVYKSENSVYGLVVKNGEKTNLLIAPDIYWEEKYTPMQFEQDLKHHSPEKVIFLRAPKKGRMYEYMAVADSFNMAFVRQQVPQIFNYNNFDFDNSRPVRPDNGLVEDFVIVNNIYNYPSNDKKSTLERIWDIVRPLIGDIIGGMLSNRCNAFESLFSIFK